MTISTFSGAANSMGVTNTDAVYNTARTDASGDLLRSNPIYFGQSAGIEIDRLAAIFDTSPLGDDDIASARLQIYMEQDSSFTDFDITIQKCAPPYPHIPVVLGDYDYNQYSDNGGVLSTLGIGAVGWKNVPLNATGIGWLNKTGITKLMVRSSRDIAGLWSGANEYIRITGPAGANAPRLEVTHYPSRVGPAIRRMLVPPLKVVPLG
jgi:hypothetical protein